VTSHRKTILVAEYDQNIRRRVCRALAWEGYKIVPVRTTEDAVRVAARHEREIDLLVTQALSPTSHQGELAELLRLDYPKLRVVYFSGSTAQFGASDLGSGLVVSMNPFRADRLRRAVREALPTRSTSSLPFGIMGPEEQKIATRMWGD
jgi:two-component system cell cycle sensor histidine kinase/response regulator CckA